MEKKREGEGEGAGLYGLRSTTKEKKWSLNSIQWRKRMKPQGKKRKTRKEKNIRPKNSKLAQICQSKKHQKRNDNNF